MLGIHLPKCINDLETQRLDLISEWDYEKNDILPSEVSVKNTTQKIWWKCAKGHSWETSAAKRSGKKGTGCPYCANQKVKPEFNDLLTKFPLVAQQWDYSKNEEGVTPSDVAYGSGTRRWWKCDKGHSWIAPPYRRTAEGLGCPKCANLASRAEQEVADYVISLIGEDNVLTSNRSVLGHKELDIYIPDKNIAIEFNGLYWHSEAHGKDRHYHYDKWKMCKDNGVQLITIWEDEWRDKKEIVKSMLAHKLGVSQEERVFARQTHVVVIDDKAMAKEFLDEHHIQGSGFATYLLGLVDAQGELVAVSAWKKSGSVLYLERYATSCSVIGGMGKLLKAGKHLARNQGVDTIVTFSDHQVSDGDLYATLGFTLDKELKPDYKYLVDCDRKHKFNYRKDRFQKDPELDYVDGLTERELAELNGLERIWDCGKTRWVMDVS